MKRVYFVCFLISAIVAAVGCSAVDTADIGARPSRNVTQGGPQDISELRAVVDRGAVPALELLNEVGFFAEHAIDLPSTNCGSPVCVHPMLAVAPRFDDGNWSMAFIGLNTTVDPATLPRRPRHLILVIERSGRTEKFLPVFAGLAGSLIPSLDPVDRVSVIVASNRVQLLAFNVPSTELPALSFEEPVGGQIDLFAALSRGYEVASADEFKELNQQMLVLSSGVNDVGVFQIDRYVALAEKIVEAGVGISAFGMGQQYRREIPEALAEVGSGNYYFVREASDLLSALRVEGKTAFIPLARNVVFTLEAKPGYRIGRVYGARRATVTDSTATLRTPALFIGARLGASDVMAGRRGGGGGWFVELLADVDPGQGPQQPAEAFSLRVTYDDPQSGMAIEQSATLSTPLGVGQNPPPTAPFFSDAARAKPFMMLNMYLALHTALSLYEAGDCGSALGVHEMMNQSYLNWRELYDDVDITADWTLLEKLTGTIRNGCTAHVAQPVYARMSCFWF